MMARRFAAPSGRALLVAAALLACKRPAPPAHEALPDALPELLVSRDAALLYTFAGQDGAFETVDKPDDVPPHARRLVRVVDPGQPASEAAGAGLVYVVDLTELERRSPVAARPVARERFETQALAQLVPGASSALADAPAAGSEPADGATAAADPAGAAGKPAAGSARVVLYGTSWCGACRSARAWFLQKGIPYVDKDIERDEAAAAELQEKAARLGVQADRVPVLDVAGRLMIGFDPGRVERILALTASGGTAL